MTTSSISDYFERKRKEVLERIIGTSVPKKDVSNETIHYTSKCKGKPWHEQVRRGTNVDRQSQEYLAWYNKQMHTCHGRIVVKLEEPVGDVVPPPVK